MNLFTRRPWGTNLLELVLAMAFCAMALLAVLGVQSRQHQALQKSAGRERGEQLALSLQADAANRLAEDFWTPVGYSRQPLAEAPGFDSEVQVVDSPPPPAIAILRKVTVTVWWTDKQGEQKATLWCYYDNHGDP